MSESFFTGSAERVVKFVGINIINSGCCSCCGVRYILAIQSQIADTV